MRILTLNDDDLIINVEKLQMADYVVELEAGETIADFKRIQNLTNDEILDESDYDEEPIWLNNDTLGGQGYSENSELAGLDREDLIFVRRIDYTENFSEEELNTFAFYMAQPDGFAYEIVEPDSD